MKIATAAVQLVSYKSSSSIWHVLWFGNATHLDPRLCIAPHRTAPGPGARAMSLFSAGLLLRAAASCGKHGARILRKPAAPVGLQALARYAP